MPDIHPFILIIDYILGIIMWTLIGRVAMNIFQRENSEFFFIKAFVKLTNPLISLLKPFESSLKRSKYTTQGFDQGLEEGNTIDTVYSTARPQGKQFKNIKHQSKTSKTYNYPHCKSFQNLLKAL